MLRLPEVRLAHRPAQLPGQDSPPPTKRMPEQQTLNTAGNYWENLSQERRLYKQVLGIKGFRREERDNFGQLLLGICF